MGAARCVRVLLPAPSFVTRTTLPWLIPWLWSRLLRQARITASCVASQSACETQDAVTETEGLDRAACTTPGGLAVITNPFSAVFALGDALTMGLDLAGKVRAAASTAMPREGRLEAFQCTTASGTLFAAEDASAARVEFLTRGTRPLLELEFPYSLVDCGGLTCIRRVVGTFHHWLSAFRLPTRPGAAMGPVLHCPHGGAAGVQSRGVLSSFCGGVLARKVSTSKNMLKKSVLVRSEILPSTRIAADCRCMLLQPQPPRVPSTTRVLSRPCRGLMFAVELMFAIFC